MPTHNGQIQTGVALYPGPLREKGIVCTCTNHKTMHAALLMEIPGWEVDKVAASEWESFKAAYRL